jgi:hypothetical protein
MALLIDFILADPVQREEIWRRLEVFGREPILIEFVAKARALVKPKSEGE